MAFHSEIDPYVLGIEMAKPVTNVNVHLILHFLLGCFMPKVWVLQHFLVVQLFITLRGLYAGAQELLCLNAYYIFLCLSKLGNVSVVFYMCIYGATS